MVFRRLIENGSQTLHLSFIVHPKVDFDVTADVAIRFDDVQEEMLFSADTPVKGTVGAKTLMSFGAELGNIRDGRQQRWTVRNQEDITSVSADIVSAFYEVGLPYLETFSKSSNRAGGTCDG